LFFVFLKEGKYILVVILLVHSIKILKFCKKIENFRIIFWQIGLSFYKR
jgi:hypothetical protein